MSRRSGTRDSTIDVVMLHYHDLKTDLEGEMRALAARLGIDVPDERWPALVEAATFESMRRASDKHGAEQGIWRTSRDFFMRGRSGAWRDLLDEDERGATTNGFHR